MVSSSPAVWKVVNRNWFLIAAFQHLPALTQNGPGILAHADAARQSALGLAFGVSVLLNILIPMARRSGPEPESAKTTPGKTELTGLSAAGKLSARSLLAITPVAGLPQRNSGLRRALLRAKSRAEWKEPSSAAAMIAKTSAPSSPLSFLVWLPPLNIAAQGGD